MSTKSAPGAPRFTITQLAEDFAITPRAIRFYEDKGLLAPERNGQARIYSLSDRQRLSLVLRGRRVGFTLAEIKELLDLYDLPDERETQMRQSLAKFRQRIDSLLRQRDDIDEAIGELEQASRTIELRLAQKVTASVAPTTARLKA